KRELSELQSPRRSPWLTSCFWLWVSILVWAQSRQRHSRKLPSGLHFHNRNLLHHSKPGTGSRPSKGKIVNLRLTTPSSLLASGFSVPHSPGRVITRQSRQPRPIL